MPLDIATAAKFLSPVAQKVAPILLKKVQSKLNPTELEKALDAGIRAAKEQEQNLPPQQELFYRSEPDFIDGFLDQFFQQGGVQEELERPLKGEGIPQVPYLVEAFKQIAATNSKIELQEERIEPWLQKFANTYFEKTSTFLRFQVAKEDYFKQLENYFDDVKFAGIAVEGQEIDFKSEKLDQIFVMLNVVEDVRTQQTGYFIASSDTVTVTILNDRNESTKSWQLNTTPGEVIPLHLPQILSPEVIDNRQTQLIREQQQRVRLENRSGKKISAVQLLNQNQSQKVVLLGAPGSGKTTLMSYFAVMLAQKHPEKLGLATDTDWLPILIRIRDLARHPNLNILDYARQFAHNTLCVNPPLPPGFFEYWLEDRRALILLDGLDEVPEEGQRDEVVRYIENFLGQFERNRAIITSRPAGYRRDFFRTDEFPHYEVQPFDDIKIEEFINRWYDSRLKEDTPKAERCKDSLRKALSDNTRIKLLARNPLLLTIITLIHRYQAILPKQRHELYDKAVETLLKSWDAKRELSHHKVLLYLELDDLRRLMESVSYWIHTQASTGDKEGGTLIDKDELIEQLSREIKALKQIKPYEAKEEAKRFVNFIRERTGLLNEQGRDCYAFVHKTFQEYLCAQEIIYQADNEDDFDIILNHIREHLHDSHWREVLLLLIAQQKPKKAARAIRAILNNGSDYEQWLHRDLLFVGSCLAENPKGLKGANNGLAEEILEKLVELEVNKVWRVGNRVQGQVFQILCSLSETAFEAQALQLLKDRSDYIDQVRFQEYRAALGEKEEAIAALREQLKDEDATLRRNAAYTLSELGQFSELTIKEILSVVELVEGGRCTLDDLVDGLCALGKTETVIPELLALLQQEDSDVASIAARYLGEIGQSSEPVLQRLFAQLQDDRIEVSVEAALVLSQLNYTSEPVIEKLLASLQHKEKDMFKWFRKDAVKALSKIGQSSEIVVQRLRARIQDRDEHIDVKFQAIQALIKLNSASDSLLQRLLRLLQHQNSWVRSRAAEALGELDHAPERMLQELLPLLEDDNSQVRSSAAQSLVKLGYTSDLLLQKILALLQDKDSQNLSWVSEALIKMSKTSNEVIPAVTQWISQHQDSEYVGNGIDALWYLVAGEQS